ncbi:MAG: response regulator [Flavobacteriales bacterium]
MNAEEPIILMIEDNPDDAELTGIALDRIDMLEKTLWIADGALAMDFFMGQGDYNSPTRLSQLKMVFLDLKLPKLNGFEVLERLRRMEAFQHLPVSILSSSAVEDDFKHAMSLGANSYLVKPIDFKAQALYIRKAVEFWTTVHLSFDK